MGFLGFEKKTMVERRVFTNGCFDVFHRGHLELLRHCRSLGYVVVGVNSDESVRRLKGHGRPINSQDDRVALLRELRCVDEVVVFDQDTPEALIRELRPDVVVKGGDYVPSEVVGNDLAEVVIFPLLPELSSSILLERFGME